MSVRSRGWIAVAMTALALVAPTLAAEPRWRDEAAARAVAAERNALLVTFVVLGDAGAGDC